MKCPSLTLVRYLLLGSALSMTACGSPGYNNNPSQQNTDDRAGCLASSDFLAVYFTVHLQPTDVGEDARITRELFQSYCNDVPKPGIIHFTADLVGNELKKIPLRIRVIDEGFVPGDPTRPESYEDNLVIQDIPAQPYPKGFIESHFVLTEVGHYAIELSRIGEDGVSETAILRIPLSVGIALNGTPALNEIVTKLSITAGVIVACFAIFWILRARRVI